jgi:hypothetical protein
LSETAEAENMVVQAKTLLSAQRRNTRLCEQQQEQHAVA